MRPAFQQKPCTPTQVACSLAVVTAMYAPSAEMSCVADRKPVTQKKASVSPMKLGSGKHSATQASEMAIANSVPMTQCFLVLNISVMGAHANLNDQGT